jgi:hypothetical protein
VAREVAERRLADALAEEARLTDAYESQVGSAGELSAYVRLRAAALRVANCNRLVSRLPSNPHDRGYSDR